MSSTAILREATGFVPAVSFYYVPHFTVFMAVANAKLEQLKFLLVNKMTTKTIGAFGKTKRNGRKNSRICDYICILRY